VLGSSCIDNDHVTMKLRLWDEWLVVVCAPSHSGVANVANDIATPATVVAMDAWMVWIVLAVILAAGEVMTLSFFLAPFAVGALLGAVAELAGLGTIVALIVFLVSSGLLLGFARPIARRHTRTPPRIRTGTAALVGQTAVVTDRIEGSAGAVKLEGEIWTARPYEEGEVIEAGRRVHVVEIRGATALVSSTD